MKTLKDYFKHTTIGNKDRWKCKLCGWIHNASGFLSCRDMLKEHLLFNHINFKK